MKLRKPLVVVVAVLAVISINSVLTSQDKGGGGKPGSSTTLVIGADQEPDCLDWISSCSGSSWGAWAALSQTLPQAYYTAPSAGPESAYVYQPSPLLAGEATIAQGAQQVITYRLNPDAVWSDGVPITGADFKYTFDQIVNGTDIYDTTGYNKIESLEVPDPLTVVVTYKETFAGWKGMFGGGYGVLPAHLLEGKARDAIMKDGYSFSGGAWQLDGGKDGWKRGVSITLVPNPRYWGQKPTIKKVVFQFITNTSTLFRAFKDGEVDFIYPQPQPDWFPIIKSGLDGATIKSTSNTGSVEALWLNNSKPPFDNVSVRQAIAYSLDRDSIVKRLFGPLGVTKAWQSFNTPIGSAYADPAGFNGYTKDLGRVKSLMKIALHAKDADGYWAKDGVRASFTLKTTVGNKRRELTAQILQAAFKDAGFEMKIKLQDAGELFGKDGPSGNFEMALWAAVATGPEPGNCVLFCSTNIPSEANDNSGQNWTHTKVPRLDPLLEQIDIELNNDKRIALSKSADLLIGESVTSLPIDPLPNTLIFKNFIGGPVADNATMGPFWNMNLWMLKG